MTGKLRAGLVLLIGGATLAAILWGLFVKLPGLTPPQQPVVPITFKEVGFESFVGWAEDKHGDALATLRISCPRLTRKGASPISSHKFPGTDIHVAGKGDDWREICDAAETLSSGEEIRGFFEQQFVPFDLAGADPNENIFTGYYEPVLQGAREASDAFSVPLLQRPGDLVHVELGNFRAHLKGERIAGRVVSGHLKPFESRAEIEDGRLPESEPLVFLASPIDAFFTHIQGSARIELTDGTHMRVNYNGQNGHPYTAIGAPLIRRGEIAREDMSMEAIRHWLKSNPDKAQDLMNENASYIFFREVEIEDPNLGPIGAQGVGLTRLRSIAVDRKFHALGLPFWIETAEVDESTPPDPETGVRPSTPFHHLMIAQDTGGAIRGPARADIFFGTGDEAARRAGPMNAPGRMSVLVPRSVAEAYRKALSDREEGK